MKTDADFLKATMKTDKGAGLGKDNIIPFRPRQIPADACPGSPNCKHCWHEYLDGKYACCWCGLWQTDGAAPNSDC
jgi:hypothetical protein